MTKRFFIFICKSDQGSVYVNPCLIESFELHGILNQIESLGAAVVDIKTIYVDLEPYV